MPAHFICRYIFMAMYNFVSSFYDANCGMLSCFGRLGCAMGEESLWSAAADNLEVLKSHSVIYFIACYTHLLQI
jgi:hypothetical protein